MITLMNRWRTKESAKSMTPWLTMQQTYPMVDHVTDVHSGKRRLVAAKVVLQGPVAYDYGGFGFMHGVFV